MIKRLFVFLFTVLLFGVTSVHARIEFDGVDDLCDVGTLSAIVGQTNVSVSFWTKLDNGTQTGDFISQRVGASNMWLCRFKDDGIYFFIGAGSQWSRWDDALVDDGDWHHVAYTYDGGQAGWNKAKLYIDGILRTAELTNGTAPATWPDSTAVNAKIGHTLGYFDGQIDELSIFITTLDASEVLNLYSTVRRIPLQTSNVTAYWSMDDGPDGTSADGDNLADSTGNGNDGTGDDGGNDTGLTWFAGELTYP